MSAVRVQPHGLGVLAACGWWEATVNGRVVATWRRWDGPEMRAYYR